MARVGSGWWRREAGASSGIARRWKSGFSRCSRRRSSRARRGSRPGCPEARRPGGSRASGSARVSSGSGARWRAMSRWIEDAGERLSLYHAATWLFVAMTAFGLMVAYWLMAKNRIEILGAAGVMTLAWMLPVGLTFVIWILRGDLSRGLVQSMIGAGNLPPAP